MRILRKRVHTNTRVLLSTAKTRKESTWIQVLLTTAKDAKVTTLQSIWNLDVFQHTSTNNATVSARLEIWNINTRTQVLLTTTKNAKITRWHECIWNVYTNIVDCSKQNHCGRVKHTGDHGLKGHGLRTEVKVGYNCGRFKSNTYHYDQSVYSMISAIKSSVIFESTYLTFLRLL